MQRLVLCLVGGALLGILSTMALYEIAPLAVIVIAFAIGAFAGFLGADRSVPGEGTVATERRETVMAQATAAMEAPTEVPVVASAMAAAQSPDPAIRETVSVEPVVSATVQPVHRAKEVTDPVSRSNDAEINRTPTGNAETVVAPVTKKGKDAKGDAPLREIPVESVGLGVVRVVGDGVGAVIGKSRLMARLIAKETPAGVRSVMADASDGFGLVCTFAGRFACNSPPTVRKRKGWKQP